MGLVAKCDGDNIVVYKDNRLTASFDKEDMQEGYQGAFKGVNKDKSTAEPYAYYHVLPTKTRIIAGWHGFYNMTHNDILSEFQGLQMKLSESGLYRDLTEKCKALYIRLSSTGRMITNIVVFGIGSFTDTMDTTCRRRRMEQLATIVLMRRLFRIMRESFDGIPIIFQDPLFSRTDKSFLEFLGFYVTNDPDAFGHIDSESLVFNISTAFYLSYRISQGCRPLMLITNMDPESAYATEDDGAPAVAEMLDEYQRDPFVEYWGDECGDHGAPASVYWKTGDKGKGRAIPEF